MTVAINAKRRTAKCWAPGQQQVLNGGSTLCLEGMYARLSAQSQSLGQKGMAPGAATRVPASRGLRSKLNMERAERWRRWREPMLPRASPDKMNWSVRHRLAQPAAVRRWATA